ncbi:MAG TPA: alpha/beta hydrolase [Solirubrobacteraceae bacterium]|nr:alpha/beta hydrolase [Solirubrobacteraceae bacterium]
MPTNPAPPEPPIEMPPARTLRVPGRGELFLRDTGGDGPVVMLLHGWLATADLNWWSAYGALTDAGYRVLAIDHRGHGRGLRPLVPFRLSECAADAAAALRQLELAPATVVGYSMGGAIAQLVARDHQDVTGGLVLSGTAQHWQEPQTKRVWRSMAVFGFTLSVAPRLAYKSGFRRIGLDDPRRTAWLLSELERHSARDVAEAGRELGRFDSRPWLASLNVPAAVVVTSRDSAVPPRKQRELAAALDASVFEAAIDHLEVSMPGTSFNGALIEAIEAVRAGDRAAALR